MNFFYTSNFIEEKYGERIAQQVNTMLTTLLVLKKSIEEIKIFL